MATITTINDSDQITTSNEVINTNFSNLNTDKIETSYLDTDTTLAANSDSKIATQKATKAYVDAGGNVNASTTTKGIVEEATQAEVTAGTASGGTGARLFVNPSTLSTAVAALLDASPRPYQQAIPAPIQAATFTRASGSNSDGSVIFMVHNYATAELFRYARDTVTGAYIPTHNVNMSVLVKSGDSGAIIVIDTFIYVFMNDNTNIVCTRYLAADLTGEQVMTVPTVACTGHVAAWTNGVNAYVVSAQSNTTSRTWSLSGTTFSAVTTTTIANFATAGNETSTFYDGTNAYLLRWSSGGTTDNSTFAIFKLTDITGATTTQTDKLVWVFSDADAGAIMIPIDSTKIYIGATGVNYDEAVIIGSTIHLIPVTKP